ncbi:MAG: hypothetical protein AB8B72_00030 [Crocinitomicaceae bacterium]
MTRVLTVFVCFSLFISVLSCKKRGCKTTYAINYDSSVQKDNNTCKYFYKTNVSAVKIMDFPDLDPNGMLWDDTSLPDLYIRFTNEVDEIKYQTTVISNIASIDTVSWSFPSSVVVDSSAAATQFKIYEVDDASARLIEKISVDFKNYYHESKTTLENDKYPDSVLFNSGGVSMMIYLNWIE